MVASGKSWPADPGFYAALVLPLAASGELWLDPSAGGPRGESLFKMMDLSPAQIGRHQRGYVRSLPTLARVCFDPQRLDASDVRAAEP